MERKAVPLEHSRSGFHDVIEFAEEHPNTSLLLTFLAGLAMGGLLINLVNDKKNRN